MSKLTKEDKLLKIQALQQELNLLNVEDNALEEPVLKTDDERRKASASFVNADAKRLSLTEEQEPQEEDTEEAKVIQKPKKNII